MEMLITGWGLSLWAVNMLSGLLIVQHAVCNLSRWQYTLRSLALWGNALLLGGGLRVLLAFGSRENPGFGEVLINAGVALLSARSMRRIYREYAEAPHGAWAHLKAEILIIVERIKVHFMKGGK